MIRSISIWAIAFSLPAAAAPVSPLDALLNRAAGQVLRFQDEFQLVACTEKVAQTKLGENLKPVIRKNLTYDYLVLFQQAGNELTVDESRLATGKAEKPGDRALLTTTGFSTLLLIFHPVYRDTFQFLAQGPDPQTGFERVRFQHVHGQRSPSALEVRGRDYPIDWQGTAWIDLKTGAIARISAGLESPMDDIGLKKLVSDVRYGPVRFGTSSDITVWLPQSAVIQADTVHQHWRNEHEFSHYRQFSVDSTQKTEAPKQIP